ncbi:MAG: hypothetical protein DI606_16870 [Sphingobium sp.]|uniref:hypothetical protein n=1 Tax=Sphingobium sp. TaxID=1912891 RepID=UPI000DAFA1CC|nr:hypothetical protein [Sphingobium sp.]PZU07350.1 MAG: hypothetical protein DI606_16870 [Sphingobium sp.]
MKAPATTALALSLMLAACNSKPEEPADASTETAQTTANVTAPAAPAAAMKPAPEGLPSRIAREVITASGQKCDGIAKAERQASDGTIVANCTGGETYRIYTEEGKGPLASAM